MRPTFLAFLVLLLGCGPQEDHQNSRSADAKFDTTAVIAKGQEISQAAFQALSRNLQQAMKEGGVQNALEFCNVRAMPLTDSLASHYGIKLRRASHQPRNPGNRADSLEMETIKDYLQELEQGGELEPVTYTDNNTITYHAPIRIPGQLCLNCHGKPGTDIAQSDIETIRKLYPEDEATGFEMGELRGIWSIQFPPDYLNQQDE